MKITNNFIVMIFSVFLSIMLITPAFSIEKGVTGELSEDDGVSVSIQPAIEGTLQPPLKPLDAWYESPWAKYTDDWTLIESQEFSVCVPEWLQFAISFNPNNEQLQFHDPNYPLSQTQTDAINRAPAWMQDDLYDNFRRFTYPFVADLVAMEILNAPDPYVDEIAFQAAHIAPGLYDTQIYIQLLMENTQYVYSVDSSLNYIEIVDYGDSNDDDYYSTARYKIVDASGDTIEVEIDKEYYYWNVVHPKVSDEVPTYINPATGNPADPPLGVFWRTYFWTHADSGREYLSDHVTQAEVLWSRTGTVGGAISEVNLWVDNNMIYQVGGERPIQPVRIYHLHMGYCGEYQDIRAAAGRTALIPTACTSNICEDHVWNEFWDEEWIHWDGGNINNPLLYENSWGKTLSGVFNWRGDGYCYTVTERYTADVCTLQVSLYDSVGKPADGVRVKIRSDAWSGGGLSTCTWGMTDAMGQTTVVLGDSQDFYLRLDGPLGNYPVLSTQYVQIIDNSEPGQLYSWEYTFEDASAVLEISEAPEYPNPLDEYMMEIEYNCDFERIYGTYITNNEFCMKGESGFADFFIVNQENYDQYFMAMPAQGFGIFENTAAGNISYILPTNETWYAVFSGREFSANRPVISGVVNIYSSSAGVGDKISENMPTDFALNNPYPNPFNSEAMIDFAVPVKQNVRISIYDLLGREIAVLADAPYSPGYHSVKWNAVQAASGIYLVRMNSGDKTFTQKVCLIK